MKFLKTLILVLALVTPLTAKTADSTNVNPVTDVCQLLTSNLENWVEGQVIPVNTLFLYFNTSQGEFDEFLGMTGVTSMDVEVTKITNDGATIQVVEAVTITDPINNFGVENWSLLLENVDTTAERYFIEVRINGEACSERVEIPLVTEVYVEELEDLPIDLPVFTCGEDYDPETVSETTSLSSASSGDVFTIGGFPILIQTVTGGSGLFSGTGIIPVPFDRKVVAVTFNSVRVNADSQIWDGEVLAISDDPDFYLNFDIDNPPLSIGGDICLPTPPPPGYSVDGTNELTGLDDYGFDPATGLNGYTGEPYDTLGFDINGLHINGTEFNECGCSREGVNEEGQSCNPDCPASQDVLDYADSVAPTLEADLLAQLGAMATSLQARIQQLDCGSTREDVEDLVDNLAFEERYIFGENREYIEPGLHLEFEREPKPVLLNTNRNAQVKELENLHIALYKCDKKEYPLVQRLALIAPIVNDASGQQIADLAQYILAAINAWSDYQYGLYTSDPNKYEEWLLRKVGDWLITQDETMQGTGQLEVKKLPYNFPDANSIPDVFDFTRKQDNRVWASANNKIGSIFDSSFDLEKASDLFRQGDQKINGIHRAFYLEELARQQRTATTGNVDYLLPLEVTKTAGNLTYTIYLDGIRFTPSSAYLNAYIIITDPETDKRIVFSGLNVPFGPTGTTEESRLYLENDVEIRLNNAAMLVLEGGPDANTYVAWNCEGFQSMGIDGQVEFCRNFITPLNPSDLTPLHDTINYRLDISVQNITSWLEFTLEVDAPPFAITKHENVKWSLTHMLLDFSSTTTPEFRPISGYTSPYWDEETRIMSPLWKGFYIEELSATLPNEFSGDGDPITASVDDLLIDGSGVSGEVEVEDLLSIGEGNMGGWPFSITDFKFRVIKNRFAGGGFAGDINIPLFEDNTEYEAVMYPGNFYSFAISPMENTRSEVFLASVEIDESSEIRVTYSEEHGFTTIATLTGKLGVDSDTEATGGIAAKLPQVCFQEFQVGNKAPYFSPGTWGIVDTNEVDDRGVGGFPIRLSKVVPFSPSDTGSVGLAFNLDLLLAEEIGVTAGGSFQIEGELNHDANGRQKWEFKRLRMNQFRIATSFPGAKIAGLLEWYDDSTPDGPGTWGKGFRGLLDAEFTAIGVELRAAAQFGQKESYKYFFVDALAEFGALGPGVAVLQLKGFGGGISYNMDVNASLVDFSTSPGTGFPPIGHSYSGTSYTPDDSKGLGLKATAIISTLKEEVFSGTVSLLFLFNDNNGLDKIAMLGSAKMLSPIDIGITADFLPNSVTAPNIPNNPVISAYASIEFDFGNSAFHGSLNTFINAAGILTGAGPGGRAVNADIHFDPEKWYIYIGTPQLDPNGPITTCGTKLTIPFIAEAVNQSYFCIGSVVPPSPPLPQEVRSIAYKLTDNPSLRQSGAGLIFGASRQINMDISIVGIVSASLEAKFGYDVMLRKYDGFVCQQDGEPIGLDGWYAAGQAYAYVYGELKVFGVNVASAGIAAALQARLPNPFYAQAVVGLQLKIGFIKVNKSLSIELGNDNCTLVSDDAGSEIGMDVIIAMTPLNHDSDVETISIPEASLAMELERDYTMASITNGVEYQYSIELAEASLTQTESGLNIPAEPRTVNGGTQIQMVPLVEMPGGDSITFTVKINVFRDGQFLSVEEKSVTFITSEKMAYIPDANVKSAYPADGMYNFYKNEYALQEGFIELEIGQVQLLTQVPSGHSQQIRLTSGSGDVSYISYSYDYEKDRVVFPLAPLNLDASELYHIELVRRYAPPILAAPLTTASVDHFMEGSGGDENASGPNPGNENVQPPNEIEERVLYSAYFRVSDYGTFEEKILALTNQPLASPASNSNFAPIATETIEVFDALETVGERGENALVSFNASISSSWVQNDIVGFLNSYISYGCSYSSIFESLNLFSSAVDLTTNSIRVTSKEFDGEVPAQVIPSQSLTYNVEEAFKEQYFILKVNQMQCLMSKADQIRNQYCSPGMACPEYDEINSFVNAPFPAAPVGSYKVKIEYRITPDSAPTSSFDIFFEKQQ